MKAKKQLHQQDPVLKEALALPAEKRAYKRNKWNPHGRHSNLQTTTQDMKYWLAQLRTSSTSK